jgi:hypothetical protein
MGMYRSVSARWSSVRIRTMFGGPSVVDRATDRGVAGDVVATDDGETVDRATRLGSPPIDKATIVVTARPVKRQIPCAAMVFASLRPFTADAREGGFARNP